MSDDNPMTQILATLQRLEAGQAKLEGSQAKLEAGHAKLEAAHEAMEARLMARMNDNQERMIERIRGVETAVSVLTEVARGTNNTLASITTMLSLIAGTQTDLGRRVTDLEKKA